MTTPKSLAELIARTVPVAEATEAPGDLILRSALAEPALRQDWRALRAAPPGFLQAVFITDAESDAVLDETSDPAPGDLFRITLRKATADGELRLLLGRSASTCADALAGCSYVQVADMAAEETFATFRARVQPWTTDPPAPFAPSEPLADPREFTKDFTGAGAVPRDIRPWLLRSAPTTEGGAFQAWRATALRRLMAAVADQVTAEAGEARYHLSGPPSQTFAVTDADLLVLAPGLFAGAEWVYGAGFDVETRHLLLANEWARAYRPDALAGLANRALESAKSAYNAYVKSSSRETLKALADLRKAVIDETQKVSQRAQDLAGALWKDLAVAATPFVVKILSDAANISTGVIAGGLAFVAAAFLAFSYMMQVHIDGRFFLRQQDSRAIWRQALNLVLSPDDIDEFSEKPIRNSLDDYRGVRTVVGIFYGLLILALIVFGLVDLNAPKAPSRPAAASAGATTASQVSSKPSTVVRPAAPAH